MDVPCGVPGSATGEIGLRVKSHKKITVRKWRIRLNDKETVELNHWTIALNSELHVVTLPCPSRNDLERVIKRTPPVRVFCWKQAAGLKGHLVRAVSCSLPWMYMLCPQPGEVTIHGLFTGEFSLAWERRIQRHLLARVFCRRLLALMLYHQNDDGEHLLRWCFEFLLASYFPWRGNREQRRDLLS